MIETKEQYEEMVYFHGDLDYTAKRMLGEAVVTIEALRPLVRSVREEHILPVGSHVTSCTFCNTSWLTDPPSTYPGEEHHETTCLLHGIPRWLADE